jgi:hypothetical protein
VLGYGALYLDQQRSDNPPAVPVLATSSNAFPQFSPFTLSTRIADIQGSGPSVIGTTVADCYNKLRAIIGPERLVSLKVLNGNLSPFRNPQLSYAERISMQRQITELCEILNRNDSVNLVDLTKCRNICRSFLPPGDLGQKFDFQMVLGYELLTRLRKEPSTISYATRIHQKISANLLISEQWIQNVRLILGYSPIATLGSGLGNLLAPGSYVFRSKIHDQQVEGMIRFAELLSWPYTNETRIFMENVVNDLEALKPIGADVLDWIYGLMLPGKEFRLRIMSCLAYSVQSVRAFRDPAFYASGLALPQSSYWPSGTVLERVLGGIRGVKTVCGWTGPCPKLDDQNIKGWVRIKARKLRLPLPNSNELEGLDADEDEELAGILKALYGSGSSKANDFSSQFGQFQSEEILRDIADIDNWVEPTLNIVRERVSPTILGKIRLAALSPEISLAGLSLQFSGYTEEERREYQATLDFTVNGSAIRYTLYTMPCFVTAQPCRGSHVMFKSQAKWYTKNVVSARNLKDYTWDGHQFLVVNALGEGQEVLARAWCAERGRHAVIRKGPGCCFTCAAKLSGNVGLGFNLLIWA